MNELAETGNTNYSQHTDPSNNKPRENDCKCPQRKVHAYWSSKLHHNELVNDRPVDTFRDVLTGILVEASPATQ